MTFFDLKSRGKVKDISLCGTCGIKFPALRQHLKDKIATPYGLDTSCTTYPDDDVKRDSEAYKKALDTMKPGDIVVVTTPDDTHFEIVLAAIEKGCHVMCTKPLVKSLGQHHALCAEAKKHNVLVCVEYHKRFDPMYNDAVQRIRRAGDLSFFQSYMTQPKSQLHTFRFWFEGKTPVTDISYYLNSHHVDICSWALQDQAVCTEVTALASSGAAKKELQKDILVEDTITLVTKWENVKSKNPGMAFFTASWIAGPMDVHSQQEFRFLGHDGEIKIDQAHRGYIASTDKDGMASINPLYMRYTPDKGKFVGQEGYGYKSFDHFVDAVLKVRQKKEEEKEEESESVAQLLQEFDATLPTIHSTVQNTAILHAGRLSLDKGGIPVKIMRNGPALCLEKP